MNSKIFVNKQPHLLSEGAIVAFASLGMLLSTLDTGIVNVALPTLQHQFCVSVSVISWIITLYSIALGSTIMTFGKLSDRFGRVRFYQLGIILFTISSFLCGLAQNAEAIIVFRGLQGIGAALLQATSAALITTLISEDRRGSALGTLGAMIGVGPILGPTLGGLIISFASWSWIFWINIPIGIIALIGSRKLPNIPSEKPVKINLLSLVLFSVSILMLMWNISQISINSITNIQRLMMILINLVFFILYIISENKSNISLIDIQLFRNQNFVISMLATVAFGFVSAIIFIIPPYFLQNVLQLSPWQVGIISFCAPIGLVIFSKISGNLLKKIDANTLMAWGLLIMTCSLIGFNFMNSQWPVALIAIHLFIYGIGGGLFQAPSISAMMGSVEPAKQSTIGALNRMTQNIAIALGATVASLNMQLQTFSSQQNISGFNHSWLLALLMMSITLIIFRWSMGNRHCNA
jgi:EmrB/QacA subfamily drug resistance transporter